MPSQIAWLATTTAAVLFLAIFGTTELLADNGAGGGSGPNPVAKPSGADAAGAGDRASSGSSPTATRPTAASRPPSSCCRSDSEIAFHVTSLDAIHSFWAYELGVKADANPGVDNVAYVKPTKLGDVPDPLRRALRPLARLHVRHRAASSVLAGFKTWIAAQRRQFAPVTKYLPKYSPTYAPDPTYRAG